MAAPIKIMRCRHCWLPASKGLLCRDCQRKSGATQFQEVLEAFSRKEDVDPGDWAGFAASRQAALLIFAYAYAHPSRYHFPRGCVAWPSFLLRVKDHQPGDLCCRGFRAMVRGGVYKERIVPEACSGCALALYLSSPEVYLAPLLDIFIYRDGLSGLFFKKNGKPGQQKEEMLSFVHEILWLPKDALFFEEVDADAKRRSILLTLRDSVQHGESLLKELVLRPENYPFLLANPPIVMECYLDLVFEDPEERWAFCSKVQEKFVKRVEMRCRVIKEELMEKTWAPGRVIPWCFSVDEKESVVAFKSQPFQ